MKQVELDLVEAPFVNPNLRGVPCINTHVVVYRVRGWTFTTQPMSEASAMLCLADFGFANPQIKFAATMRKLP